MSKLSKYRINENLYRCECGKEFSKFQSLNAHFSHCDYHHDYLGTVRKLRPSEINHSMNWENKSQEEIQEIHKKSGKTTHIKCLNGLRKGTFNGCHHTEKSKQQTRESTIKYIESLNGSCKPRYNKNACKFINKLNEENKWNLQHAENGGEFKVCGYFVDGYDKERNIVFEYDESTHYKDKENNILKDRDLQRQLNIISNLHCEFWRYNEYLNLLYKVN